MKSLRLLFIVGCMSMLVACGQKGDLYFPDNKTDTSNLMLERALWVSYGLF